MLVKKCVLLETLYRPLKVEVMQVVMYSTMHVTVQLI